MHDSVKLINTKILNRFTVVYELTLHTHFFGVALILHFTAIVILPYGIWQVNLFISQSELLHIYEGL